MTLVETLGSWIAGVRAEDLPEEVRERAKLCLLDFLGVAMRAEECSTSSLRAAERQLLEVLGAEDAARDCTVLSFPARLSALNAAMLNSLVGFGTSLDDTAGRPVAHTACSVMPAVLALAERHGTSGAEVVAAIVAGYETMIRVGRAIMPSTARRGFHTTAVTAPFGAAAAAARLLKLDGPTAASALATAGDFGAGVQEVLLRAQPAGKLAVARGVQGGVLAATLAKGGLEGAPAFLESPQGFLRAMADEPHPELATAGLGTEFEILWVGFKFHTGCRHWHAAADAAVKLRKEAALVPEEVESVHVHTYREALRMDVEHPRTPDEARFCGAFALAQVLLGHDVLPAAVFSEEELARPEVRALMARVGHSLDEALDARYPAEMPARVEIRTKRGETLRAQMDCPMGDPGNFDAGQVRRKFATLAGGILGADGAAEAMALVDNLERLPNLQPLLRLLGEASTGTSNH